MTIHQNNELFTTLSWSDYSEDPVVADELSFDSTSECATAENSEDRDFFVSDGASTEHSSSVSESPAWDLSHGQNEELGQLWPIKAIAMRRVQKEGSYIVNYLVLWGSWEEKLPEGESIGVNLST